MATRSMISIKNEDETHDAVYCHFDGYPSGVGNILKTSYTSEDKIRQLIAGGAMSCLVEEVDDCEFYTKRGEQLHNYKELELDVIHKKANNIGCEYLYIFQDNKWLHLEL